MDMFHILVHRFEIPLMFLQGDPKKETSDQQILTKDTKIPLKTPNARQGKYEKN